MQNSKQNVLTALLAVLIVALACNVPGSAPTEEVSVAPTAATTKSVEPTPEPSEAEPLPIQIEHVMFPSNDVGIGGLIFDVRSDGTASENRAPYGDAYGINRFERPFLKDMTYVSDMDILSHNISGDEDWLYVSIELIGSDPNNAMGIHYGVEFDMDWDGFGDFIVWGSPPYTSEWTTDTVQVYKDDNKDTAGLSPTKSDAPFDGNGYEMLIFDRGEGDDPDLAWMRVNAGERASVQFAVKRSLIAGPFMFGVVADGGLQDVSRYDYNDRYTESDAGSPEINEPYYPLNEIFGVDNSCQTAIGFSPTGFEAKLCPVEPTPTPGPRPPRPPSTPGACQPPADGCPPGWWWVGEPGCYCDTLY